MKIEDPTNSCHFDIGPSPTTIKVVYHAGVYIHGTTLTIMEIIMKKVSVILIIVIALFSVTTATNYGTLKFTSNTVDYISGQAGDDVEPYIVIDEENEDYGLCFSRSIGTFDPYPVYAYKSGGSWTYESIQPVGASYEYLQPQMQILEDGDRIFSFRYSSDFNYNDYYSKGIWATYLDPNTGTWGSDNSEGSFNVTSFRDYASGSEIINFLSIWNYNSTRTLKYFYRDAAGNYSNGSSVKASSNLWVGLPAMDIAIGDNGTQYFCYRLSNANEDVIVKENGESELVIGSSYYTSGNWNAKLHKMSSPGIAYNSQSGNLMVVYADYNSGTELWGLYYSISEDDGGNWSTPALIFSNSVQATHPHIVADKNSGDFFISFLSFDDSSQNNSIYLKVIRYVESEEAFWPTPISIADIGDIGDYGDMVYRSRAVHSVVLPYEQNTELVVASLYFDSSTDTDVRIYEVDFPSTTSITFSNIVVDEDGGGQLKLTNNSTSSSETFSSGSARTVSTSTNYTIETLPRVFEDYEYDGAEGDYQHHNWNSVDDKYILENDFTPNFYDNTMDAKYYEINGVSIYTPAPINYYDPWYYDVNTQSQPDDYRSISSGSYDVFLDENSTFDNTKPIYSLQASRYQKVGDTYYLFKQWTGNNAVDFGGGDTTSTDIETDVVFSSGAQVTAEFYTVEVDDDVIITYSAGDYYIDTPGKIATTDSIYKFTGWQLSNISVEHSSWDKTKITNISGSATANTGLFVV